MARFETGIAALSVCQRYESRYVCKKEIQAVVVSHKKC
jgi:hypothetical protein